MYSILTNQQLNLASAWERFQQQRFGNVLIEPEMNLDEPQQDRVAKQVEQNYLIKSENLNQ